MDGLIVEFETPPYIPVSLSGRLECFYCRKLLFGGIDTFGPHDQPVCADHWYEHLVDAPNIDALMAQLADLEDDLSDIEYEIDDLEEQKDEIETKIDTLKKQIAASGGSLPS